MPRLSKGFKKLMRSGWKNAGKKKPKLTPKKKVPKGLSIKSPGGQKYLKLAEKELKSQTKSAGKKK